VIVAVQMTNYSTISPQTIVHKKSKQMLELRFVSGWRVSIELENSNGVMLSAVLTRPELPDQA
jgi:hypothetical protein